GVVGGGGGVQDSSKGGFTHAGKAPDGAIQVEVGWGWTVVVVVVVVTGGGAIALAAAPTARLLITPPIPPTTKSTMSFNILV
uniref:hypothetical protein n=1 Tax=Escherichia coli TaxID=562 RepID=UPI0021C5DA4C